MGNTVSGDTTNGRGVYKYDSGSVYDGEWKDGNRHGKGIKRYANGTVYDGEWKDGKRTGTGVKQFANGDVYDGEFMDDKMHGRGVKQWADGNEYDGEFKDDKMHGRGTYCLSDGRRFEGAFSDHCLTAGTYGTYTDESGARFMVEMMANTHLSELSELGDGAFKSKAPLLCKVTNAGYVGVAKDELYGDFKPLSKYAAEPEPSITCIQSITEANKVLCPDAPNLDKVLSELTKIVLSKLSSARVQAILRGSGIPKRKWNMYLAAIIMYTFDLSLIVPSYNLEDNFYFSLNKVLRERDEAKIAPCGPYLHYLMKGLESLQPFVCDANTCLWRGVSREGRDLLVRNYRRGRKVHWSSFSSASPSREVALRFAGAGGVLLRVDLMSEGSSARDIRDLAALRGEDEVLLLPNFVTTVAREIYQSADDGFDTIDLLEQSEETFVF